MKRYVYAVTLVILSACFLVAVCAPAHADDHGDSPNTATELLFGRWEAGTVESSTDLDFFRFQAEEGKVYSLQGRFEYSEDSCQVNCAFLQPDGTGSIAEFWDGLTFVWTCPANGTYYLRVTLSCWGIFEPCLYFLKVTKISERYVHVYELLGQDRLHEALQECLSQLELAPEDPELNFCIAVLRLIDVIETPDSRLAELLDVFGVTAGLIPDATFFIPEQLPGSAPSCTAVVEYAVEILLPTIDSSLANLAKVSCVTDVSIHISHPFDSDQRWFIVDQGDAFVLQGGLCILKSMICAMHAYSLDVDANVLDDTLNERDYPSETEHLLAAHPQLLRARSDIASDLHKTLEQWLRATAYIKQGVEFKSREIGYQGDDLFSIEPLDAAHTVNFMTLLGRVFEGLLRVTGGDINADGRVDEQDLLHLQMLWHREIP